MEPSSSQNNSIPKEPVFELQPKLEESIKTTPSNDLINMYLVDLDKEAQGYLGEVYRLKAKQRQELVDSYAQKYYEVKLDYDKYMETHNEQDLLRDLENRKNYVIEERADLLESTYEMSDDYKTLKKKMLDKEKGLAELDEEVKFLMEKIEFSGHQQLRLSDKVETLSKEITELDPGFQDVEERDIVSRLAEAPHGKQATIPDFLQAKTRTQTHFRIGKAKKGPAVRNESRNHHNLFFTQEYREDPKKTNCDLEDILQFVTENKYVIEAIFENVLLESQLLNQVFTSFNDSEKKVLMESLMLNEEFKEYVYQKIAKEEMHKLDQDYDMLSKENFNVNISEGTRLQKEAGELYEEERGQKYQQIVEVDNLDNQLKKGKIDGEGNGDGDEYDNEPPTAQIEDLNDPENTVENEENNFKKSGKQF